MRASQLIRVFDRREAELSELARAVGEALDGDGELPRDQVVVWCETASDLESLALLYRLTGESYDRIRPELGQKVTCSLIRRYLLECMRVDPNAEGLLGRCEASQVLLSWLWHLSAIPGTKAVLEELAASITSLYLAGDDALRETIATGFLEHALEDEEYRPLFANWAEHEKLRETWAAALEWGKAHPRFTRKLFAQLSEK